MPGWRLHRRRRRRGLSTAAPGFRRRHGEEWPPVCQDAAAGGERYAFTAQLDGAMLTLRMDGSERNVSLSFDVALVGDGAALGDYWIAPERLAAMQPGEAGGTRILRGPYTLGGRTYDAVMLRSDAAQRLHNGVGTTIIQLQLAQ